MGLFGHNPITGLPWWLSGKEPTCQWRKPGFSPCIGKIPWRRKWQPTPVSLPGKSYGQRSLVGYSPWGHKESDTAERLSTHAHRWTRLSDWARMHTDGAAEGVVFMSPCVHKGTFLWAIHVGECMLTPSHPTFLPCWCLQLYNVTKWGWFPWS